MQVNTSWILNILIGKLSLHKNISLCYNLNLFHIFFISVQIHEPGGSRESECIIKQWEAVERFANMMFCCLFPLLQGHHKDKNNPPWQICFQKVSLSFSIISEKYCPIVLTPIECFDRGLMYYPVFPVIQMPPPLVLGKNMRVWNGPLGIPLKGFFIPRHMLRHVKFLIWWKHLPAKDNCANANTQPTGRRDHLSMRLDIAGSNLLVLAGVQNEMRILQLMLRALLINLSRMWLQSTCKIWDSRN